MTTRSALSLPLLGPTSARPWITLALVAMLGGCGGESPPPAPVDGAAPALDGGTDPGTPREAASAATNLEPLVAPLEILLPFKLLGSAAKAAKGYSPPAAANSHSPPPPSSSPSPSPPVLSSHNE